MEFWDFLREARTPRSLPIDIASSRESAIESSRTASNLDDRIDRLTLVCRAMWELLGTRAGVTEGELLEKISEIDLRDGRADGIYRRPAECIKCGRKMSQRHTNCMYCGAKLGDHTAFDHAS